MFLSLLRGAEVVSKCQAMNRRVLTEPKTVVLAGTTCSSPAEIYNYVRTMGLFVYAMYMSCMCLACALHGYLNCHKRTVLSLCIYLSHSVSLSVSTLLSVVITLIQYLASAHYMVAAVGYDDRSLATSSAIRFLQA